MATTRSIKAVKCARRKNSSAAEKRMIMRNHLAESLCIGGLIGLAVLLVHLLTANAAPQIQLLALLAAACLIACSQIAFTIWYERRGIPSGSLPDDQVTHFLRFRRNRRN